MPLAKGRRGSNASMTRDGQNLPPLSRQNSRSDAEGRLVSSTAPHLPHGSVTAPPHSNNQQLEYTQRQMPQAPSVTRYPQPTAGPAPSFTRAYESDQSHSGRGGSVRPAHKERRMTYDGAVSKGEVQPDTRDRGWSLGAAGSRFSVPLNDTPDFWNSVGVRPASRPRSNSAASQKSNYTSQPIERPDSVRIRKNSLSKSSVHSIPVPLTPHRAYPIRNANPTVPSERKQPIKSVGQYLRSTARWIGGWSWIVSRKGGQHLANTRRPVVRTNSSRGRMPTRHLYTSPNELKQQKPVVTRQMLPGYNRPTSSSRSRSRDAPVLERRSTDRSYRDTPRPTSHINLSSVPPQSGPDRSLRRRGSDPLSQSHSSQLTSANPLDLLSSVQAFIAEKNESREAERVLLDNTMHNAHNLKYNPLYDGYVPQHEGNGNIYEVPIIRPPKQRRRVSDSQLLVSRPYVQVAMQIARPMGLTPSGYTPAQAPFAALVHPQHSLPPTSVPGYLVTESGQPISSGHFSRRRGGSVGEMVWTPSVGIGSEIRQYGSH